MLKPLIKYVKMDFFCYYLVEDILKKQKSR